MGLPSNISAEKMILGAVLLEPNAFEELRVVLKPVDFSLDSHQRIAAAMGRLVKRDEAIDLVTLANEMARTKEIKSAGGVAYLTSLTEGLPRRPHIAEYLRIVKDKSALRSTMLVCSAAIARAADQGETALEILNATQEQLEAIAARQVTVKERTLGEQVYDTMEKFHRERKGEVKTFIPAGFELIDNGPGGYAKGELTIIAAREKVGKSVLLRQAVYDNCDQHGNFCHMISPEVDEDRFLRMLAARKAQLPWKLVRHPQTMNPMQVSFLTSAMSDIAEWPLKLDCRYPITPLEVISSAKAVKAQHNTQLLGVDYLQKLDWGTKYEHRHAMIGDAWVGLANLAKDGDQMAVVAISALTTEKGSRNNPPTPDDLRGSGQAKYELSTLYLLHRKTDQDTGKMARDGQLITGLARFDEDGSQAFVLNSDSLTLEVMR